MLLPDGRVEALVSTPDLFTTNTCFGGPHLTTACVTLSGPGRLAARKWPRPSLALAHTAAAGA